MKTLQIILGFCLILPMSISGAGDDKSRSGASSVRPGASSVRPGASSGGSGASSNRSPHPAAIGKAIEIHGKIVNTVLEMTKKGQSINDILKPMHFLRSTSSSFVFKGKRWGDNIPVAIKFINRDNVKRVESEYEMYSYLNAINNTAPEKYGIQTMHYLGVWKDYIVMAFTELEESIADRAKSGKFKPNDILLLTQQFIKQSKYIHSCGVRKDSIEPNDILTWGCESFLNDFNYASKMKDDKGDYTTFMLTPLKIHQKKPRAPMDDWESFLFTMCKMASVPLEWFKEPLDAGSVRADKAVYESVGKMKENRTKIRDVIKEKTKDKAVKEVLLALADEVFSGKLIPNYDKFNVVVNKVIGKSIPGMKCFSWAQSDPDKQKIANSLARLNVDISKLKIPKEYDDYKKFPYPSVNRRIFDKEGFSKSATTCAQQ